MQARPPQQRTQLGRAHTTGPTMSYRHDHAAGEFTPEVSPLDQFIYKGRKLKKELNHAVAINERGLPPRITPINPHHRDPHSGRPTNPVPIGEDEDFPTRSDSSGAQRADAPAHVEMRMPRFSTITNDSFGDRDSMYSNDRDSTILGAFSFGFNPAANNGPPDIKSAPKTATHEYSAGRDSVRPVISHSGLDQDIRQAPQPQTARHEYNAGRESVSAVIEHLDEDLQEAPQPQTVRPEFNPVRESVRPVLESVDDEISPTGTSPYQGHPRDVQRAEEPGRGAAPGVQRGGLGGQRGIPVRRGGPGGPGGLVRGGPGGPGGLVRGGPGSDRRPSPDPASRRPDFGRAQSQPQRRPQRAPVRQASADDYRGSAPRVEAYAARQYQPYRQDVASSSPTGYGPPKRQGSAESGRFPPPNRTGSGNSMIPERTDSRGSDRHFGPPSRQNSDEVAPIGYVPYRQGSADSLPARQNSVETGGRGTHRNAPPPHPPSIVPMISGVRAMSPESPRELSPGVIPSPMPSPNPWTIERSPSASSDANSIYSIGGTRKPAFNFSRPLSSRPSMDSQRPSIDTNLGLEYNDALPTPRSIEETDTFDEPAPTFVYTKFELPRGRAVGRESVVFQDSHPDIEALQQQVHQHQANQANQASQANQANQASQSNTRPSVSPSPPKANMLSPPPRMQPAPSPSSPRPDNRTLKPSKSPMLPPVPAATMSPDDHLTKGIDLHEKGSLQESTYHLRCAAHGGHPTGMLLYALACRHGWGMRPNQKEGVDWLKKVTQLASSEVADDEKGVTNVPFLEKQGRRAQFALSIYELGVSHLNGWGTDMDKGLALNCFEIAGKWGDPDALSEAGFCYANGVGCKKDMKKAARFYRLAEAKGVNMVGNSWIWKDKYLDEEGRAAKAKKEGSIVVTHTAKKEGGGGLFSRKKSLPT